MRFHVTLPALALVCGGVMAQSTGRQGHGLIGYGITMYKPECAFACRGALPRSAIPCDIHLNGHHSSSVSAECLAESEAYLESAAWCLSVKCGTGTGGEGVAVSELEKWWELDLVGRELVQPAPRWTYQEALARVEENPPKETLEEDGVFNRTVLVDEETYVATWNGNTAFEAVEINHETYGIVLLVTGAGIPLFLSLLRFIPLKPSFVSKMHAYLIDPPLLGTRHAVPVLGLAMTPTRGQSLFILYLVAVNVILSAVGYRSRQPHSWYPTGVTEEIINYVANRTGVLSFANLPLLILYSGRNNVLLWLTNWSHSTFLLLHRWVATLCVIQACLHSALWLHLHVAYYKDHSEVAVIPYWYWGIIATLALALMLPLSVLPLRRKMYEVFHAAHIALAVLTIVGCWYHIIYRYQRQWGYETWVLVAIAVWAFEWVLRAARVARNGVKRAYLTRIDADYLRIDVPGVVDDCCRGHAYFYFPTLSWRVWESHPFSIAGSIIVTPKGVVGSHVPSPDSGEKETGADVGAQAVAATSSSSSDIVPEGNSVVVVPTGSAVGITLFVRVHSGITSHLASHAASSAGLPLLVESSYGHESRLYPAETRPSADYPNTIFIAGGVGITAVLPALSATSSLYRPLGSTKLYWGVREQAKGLVRSVREMLAGDDVSIVDGTQCARWGDVDVRISVGERFDLRAVIEAEVASQHGGTTVMVCGPAGMTDEVRAVVSGLGRHGSTVRLVEESFAW